jgi:hypothetical protein
MPLGVLEIESPKSKASEIVEKFIKQGTKQNSSKGDFSRDGVLSIPK